MSSKTIKVNPDFFSLSGSRSKTKKNITRSNRENKKKELKLLQPNKAKKRLLEKIKEHQKAKQESNKKQLELDTKNRENNNDENEDFKNELSESINYLDDVIKQHKDKKRQKKHKHKHREKHVHQDGGAINTSQPDKQIEPLNQPIIKSSTQIQQTLQPQPQPQQLSQPIIQLSSNANEFSNHNHTIKRYEIKEDPPYGVLKGGSKPTYSQYHTLKYRDSSSAPKDTKPRISIDDFQKGKQDIERRDKLNRVKTQIKEERKPKKSFINQQRFKKFRIKKTTRTYKLGKHKDKRCVSVLLKNNITKKKVNSDLAVLRKTPVAQIKKYLRDKNLIKYSSNTPEYVLRSMYMNAMLCGDIENVNKSNLIYNYLNSKNDSE